MKLIDKKGRLFGKVNIIDLLVVLLVLAAVAAVCWKVAGRRAAASVAAPKHTVSFTVVFEDTQADICSFAKTQEGRHILNDSRQQEAVITSVQTKPSAVSEGHFDLYMSVEGPAVSQNGAYKVGPQEVRVGYEYILKTSEFEMTGVICSMEVRDG